MNQQRRWLIWNNVSHQRRSMFAPNDILYFLHIKEGTDVDEDIANYFKWLDLPNELHAIHVKCSNNDEMDVSMIKESDHWLAKLRLDEQYFCTLLNKLNINAFYGWPTFHSIYTQSRNILLSETYFRKIFSLWHAVPFLGHQRLDWMGSIKYSTLAQINVNNIPEINSEQIEVLDCFMTKFLSNKLREDKKHFQSTEEIKDIFKTNKPVAVILTQVIGDAALIISPDKIYHDYTWIPDFMEKHQDIFFIIKDHPEQHEVFTNHPQRNFWDEQNGTNWIYLPPDSEYDTLSLSMHADFAVTFNSRAGLEALYWTTLVCAGDRYRDKEICYYLEDFHAKVPPKKRSNVLKFMYYVVTRCLFVPGLNGNKDHFYRWLEWTNEYRLSVGTSQTNLRQATLQELDYLNNG